jgi:hypothetical protein
MSPEHNEYVVAAAWFRPAPRRQREPPTEKRVPGVGYLDHTPFKWVLEGGID